MRKAIYLTMLVTVFTAVTAMGQKRSSGSSSYTTALGLKFYPGAVSLKHFVKENQAIEGLGYFWSRGFRITGLYEIHGNLADVDGLKWYAGPGAHIGFYSSKYGGGSSVGVDGVLGLDYKIQSAPINLSLDWQPSLEFGDGRGFSGDWGGLAIRYTF